MGLSSGCVRARRAQQQPVLWRDNRRNVLGPDPVALLLEAHRRGVDSSTRGDRPNRRTGRPGRSPRRDSRAAPPRARAAVAWARMMSVRAPHAWLETTTSSLVSGTSSSEELRKVTRPLSRGQTRTRASCTAGADGGSAASTATAEGDEASRSSITCASSPMAGAESTTRPPRNSRRARRATSQASYSSLRGRQPAAHTARPMRSKSVSAGNRPRS